jgi:hypothetical protein
LMPLMRMTMPRSMNGKTITDVRPGQKLGRSWILLFGMIPFDYDDIVIAELDEHRFLETSTMLSMKLWRHERQVEVVDGAVELTDRVNFELRKLPALIPGVERLVHLLIARVFKHRHMRLRAYFQMHTRL